jgi:glycogen(starch) synthase
VSAAGPAPLRILIVVSRYPPHHLGGYELRCRDVARSLAARGHDVRVLTSDVGARGREVDEGVRVLRLLHLFPEGVRGRGETLRFVRATSADCALLRREERDVDVVHYWHQAGLSSALLALRPPRGCGVLCDVSSDWLLDSATTGGNWFRIWEKRPSSALKRAAKAALRPLVGLLCRVPTRRPRFPPGRTYFTSEENRRRYAAAGVDVASATTLRSGVDLTKFQFVDGRPAGGPVILFLSRVKRRKGLHTVVLAMRDLPRDARLLVVGPIESDEYLAEVAEMARAAGVFDRVSFRGAIAHEETPAMLASAHVLVSPSEEPEAFSRLVLEAFAVGTPVVATTIGGTGEVLVDGETGLAFPPGDAHQLAERLARILSDAALRARIVANARRVVQERYSIEATVDRIEALLREAAAGARGAA